MELIVFQSDKGDCLLLTSRDNRRVLIDGGMAKSYTEFVAPALGALQQAGDVLNLVYVSHIDSDHISGVLRMMDDAVDWRVHDYQLQNGNPGHKAPKSVRPPDAKAVWHNAFYEQLGKNAGPIEDMLAASAAVLSGHKWPSMRQVALDQRELIQSEQEAIKLSRRVGPAQLNIPLNAPAGGKLMLTQAGQKPIKVGALRLMMIGPAPEDLTKLRKEWNEWLKVNKAALDKIRKKAAADEDRLASGEIDELVQPLLAQARVFGDRKAVTLPNLASLMFLVEEQGGTGSILLTGDGHADDILKGLRHVKKLDGANALHVDVLKVQHHGAEYNMTRDFAKEVTADHYIFCGNGAHKNPDLETLEVVVDSRIGDAKHRGSDPEVTQPFKIWCNSSSAQPGASAANKKQMRAVEKYLQDRAAKSKGKLKVFFLKGSSFSITV